MQQKFLSYNGAQISYLSFGKGPKLAICFPGFGEEGNAFSFFETGAGDAFTFLAIDLPFHGKTRWESGKDFGFTDLENIMEKLLSENDFLNPDIKQPITLVGFSLGGRVALCLYQLIPHRIEKILLLAPDGLKVNFWYWLSTQTRAGKKLFSFTMKNPGWFFGFLNIINKLGLVNASVFKFVNYYIGNKEARSLLYQRWISLRKLKPDLKKIKTFIRENKSQVSLVYGKHDRIILPSRGKKFRKGIEDYSSLTIINSGHQVLHEKHSGELLPLLIDKKDNH